MILINSPCLACCQTQTQLQFIADSESVQFILCMILIIFCASTHEFASCLAFCQTQTQFQFIADSGSVQFILCMILIILCQHACIFIVPWLVAESMQSTKVSICMLWMCVLKMKKFHNSKLVPHKAMHHFTTQKKDCNKTAHNGHALLPFS